MHTIVFEHSIEYVENARASRPRDAAVSNLFRYRLWQTLCSKKSRSPTFIGSIVCLFVLFFLHMTPTFSAHSVRSHTAQRFHWNISTIQKCGNILRFVCIDEKTHTQLIIGFYASWKKTPSLKQNNKSKQNIRTQFTQAQIKNAWSTRDLLDICHFCSSTWMGVSLME